MKILHVFTLATTAESFFDGQFKYLVENGQKIDLVCSPDIYVEEFAERNRINYIPIQIARSLSMNSDVKAVRQLYSLIKRNDYDVVVGHTPKGALLSMIAAKLARTKRRVYLRHGVVYTTASGIKRTILKMEEKFVSSLATKIINVSPSLGELVVKDKINKEAKQTVIGKGTCGGIDTIDTFNPEKIDKGRISSLRFSQNISEGDYVIGFCGRLCKDKGIPELIDGFNLFREKYPETNAKLLLIGGYDGRDTLPESIHKTIESDNDIIHTGHIIKDIQNYYALMDVFVFPSHREGFGMCSIEAQAMGVPALVAKSHGCIDTIVDWETGFYIDLTRESICDKLFQLYDSKKRRYLGNNARSYVCENFERTTLWPEILEYYNSLILKK